MTTKVDIFASHGVPVDVTPISRPEGVRGETVRIAANAHGSAFVHAGQDLLVREVQPEDDVGPASEVSVSSAAIATDGARVALGVDEADARAVLAEPAAAAKKAK